MGAGRSSALKFQAEQGSEVTNFRYQVSRHSCKGARSARSHFVFRAQRHLRGEASKQSFMKSSDLVRRSLGEGGSAVAFYDVTPFHDPCKAASNSP